MVRAKFKVDRCSQTVYGHEVQLSPVMGGSEENKTFWKYTSDGSLVLKTFWKYTPDGSLVLNTINAEAAKQFIPGGEVYLDFIFLPKE
jgi:hypothetical protein